MVSSLFGLIHCHRPFCVLFRTYWRSKISDTRHSKRLWWIMFFDEARNLYKGASKRFVHYYPLSSITITPRVSDFITPEIKYILRRKNRFLSQSQVEKPSNLVHPQGVDSKRRANALWQAVNLLTKKPTESTTNLWLMPMSLTDSSQRYRRTLATCGQALDKRLTSNSAC